MSMATITPKYFSKRRGLAVGIAGSGQGLQMAALPLTEYPLTEPPSPAQKIIPYRETDSFRPGRWGVWGL